MNRLDQGLGIHMFQEIAGRSPDDRREHRLIVLIGGEKEHPRRGTGAPDGTAGVHSTPIGQTDIHQDDIRLKPAGRLDGPLDARRFADDRDPALSTEEGPQSHPRDFMVVHDHYLDRCHIRGDQSLCLS